MPMRTDGISFIPAIEGRAAAQPKHAYLYWEFYEGRTSQAVRFGDWKAIRIPMLTGDVQLYNLKTDLHEDHDVSARYPEEVNEAEALMDEAHRPRPAGAARGQ